MIHLHESFKLKEFAMQIFKVLFEKVPEPVIKHDLHQDTKSLLLWHLKKTKTFSFQSVLLKLNRMAPKYHTLF